jgi:NAD(P)-dependent dehydrogenase (short-subunit alcohol dehydrogenase family)
MPQRLLNKMAVVTGATGELGPSIVQRFLAEGAKVVLFGRNRPRLDELAALAPARVLVVEGDVTNAADIESLVATTVRRFGGVDVLVLAAGIRRAASLEECTPEFVSGTFAVNFQGALEVVRLFQRHLNSGASIVFLTGVMKSAPRDGLGPFAASKAALASLAQSLGAELAPRGTRVNCLAPAVLPEQPDEDASTRARRNQRRALYVAETVLFLASDESAGVSGQELVVDGPLA